MENEDLKQCANPDCPESWKSSSFFYNSHVASHVEGWCIPCLTELADKLRQARRDKSIKGELSRSHRKVIEKIPGKAWCSFCQQHLPIEDFHKKTKVSSKPNAYCKICASEYHTRWFQRAGKKQRQERRKLQEQKFNDEYLGQEQESYKNNHKREFDEECLESQEQKIEQKQWTPPFAYKLPH